MKTATDDFVFKRVYAILSQLSLPDVPKCIAETISGCHVFKRKAFALASAGGYMRSNANATNVSLPNFHNIILVLKYFHIT